ncbi:MAG: restriction endonuclease subunit S, partial [Candidatus Accumulibacter sp.]|nr:restriction endonuclease subunit S [Accumulibacter sp.]
MSVRLLEQLDLIADAPNGIQKLRGLILELAVRGKLVPQDPNDEPASELLKRIAKERVRLEAEGLCKKSKPGLPVGEGERPFALPDRWRWVRFADVTSYIQRGKGPDYADQSNHVVVSQKCVRWSGLDLTPARCITPESFAKYDSVRLLRQGDILWNSTGTGTIGRAVVLPELTPRQTLVADSHVTVVRGMLIAPAYLWRWIQSPSVQGEIEGSASGSTNQIELATSTVISHLV